jgi:hypothetical protein
VMAVTACSRGLGQSFYRRTGHPAHRPRTKEEKSMIKLRNASVTIAIFSSIAMVPTTGFAWKATPAQRAACTGDALRLCASHIPNEESVGRCIMSKKSQLSPSCLAQVNQAGG